MAEADTLTLINELQSKVDQLPTKGTLKALERGSRSVYYPIIRSSPLAIVFVNWLAFDQSYELKVLLGIGLVLIGVIMLQKSARGVTGDKKSLCLALLAMLGSAAYTVADANAMSVISPSVFCFTSILLSLWDCSDWAFLKAEIWRTQYLYSKPILLMHHGELF